MKTGIAMFPGGNSGMTRLIVKTLIPDRPSKAREPWKPCGRTRSTSPLSIGRTSEFRLRLDSTVVRVEHLGEPSKGGLRFSTYSNSGRLYRVKRKRS